MSSITSTCLESLSNELLLDIFEYLDGYDLCQAFYGLNYRINVLLRLAHLHILYNESKKDKTVWNTLTSFLNPSQIRILSSYDNIDIDDRVLSASNANLHTVCLQNVTLDYVDKVSQHFPNDNQIKCLSVNEKRGHFGKQIQSIMASLLVNHGHHFVSLVRLSISNSRQKQFPITAVTFPRLLRLSIINCYFTTDFLQFLKRNTPNLRSLKLLGSFQQLLTPSSDIVKHIHELHIDHSGGFSTLENVLSNFPGLRRLHIDRQSDRRYTVLNGAQWQQLIELYLPDLTQLTIEFEEGVDENILQTFYTREFWSTKKVKARMVVNKTQYRYRLVKTIYFGKEWHFGYFDNL